MLIAMNWTGVMPAITTPFQEDGSVDLEFLAQHVDWLITNGSTGIVALGSLGEGGTLSPEEKLDVLRVCVDSSAGRVPIIAGIAALRTDDAVGLAKSAENIGCSGLMVLPQYVYRGDWRENKAHLAAVISSTGLSCMLYNNPVAYGIDFIPEQVAECAADFQNLHAVKESSTDVRRITAIRALLGDRLRIFVGVDDVIVEGIAAGAVGWIAGLVNAFPAESVEVYELAMRGDFIGARTLYEWFLPLLRLDTVPKFVQLIKLVQQEVGQGSERVRMPRMPLVRAEREACLQVLNKALQARPTLARV
jgi:4-hydroxy-tetrahydrodipicolinate synthase